MLLGAVSALSQVRACVTSALPPLTKALGIALGGAQPSLMADGRLVLRDLSLSVSACALGERKALGRGGAGKSGSPAMCRMVFLQYSSARGSTFSISLPHCTSGFPCSA